MASGLALPRGAGSLGPDATENLCVARFLDSGFRQNDEKIGMAKKEAKKDIKKGNSEKPGMILIVEANP